MSHNVVRLEEIITKKMEAARSYQATITAKAEDDLVPQFKKITDLLKTHEEQNMNDLRGVQNLLEDLNIKDQQ